MSNQKNIKLSERLPRRFITPVTGAMSLVIGFTGAMLFFNGGGGPLMSLHEWLGMAFAVVMLIHLVQNWTAFKKYFKKPGAWLSTAMVAAISAGFIVTSVMNPGGSPMMQIVHSIETTAVSDLAPVFKINQSEIAARFENAGVEIKTGQETIQELADMNGIEPKELVVSLVR